MEKHPYCWYVMRYSPGKFGDGKLTNCSSGHIYKQAKRIYKDWCKEYPFWVILLLKEHKVRPGNFAKIMGLPDA